MIDVLLVMLIFFMTITSSQVLRVDKSIKLPVAPNAQKKDASKSEAIVNVRWSPETKKAQVLFEEKAYDPLETLTPVLKARHDKDPKYRVIIRGDQNLPAANIGRVMNICGEAGIADIAFSAVNRQ